MFTISVSLNAHINFAASMKFLFSINSTVLFIIIFNTFFNFMLSFTNKSFSNYCIFIKQIETIQPNINMQLIDKTILPLIY